MKNHLFVFLTLLFSGSVGAQELLSTCNTNSVFDIAKDMEKLYNPECKDSEMEKQCECFRTKKNPLIESWFKTEAGRKEKVLEDNQKKNHEKFINVYRQMTIESAAQMSLLDLDNKEEKHLGCPPQQIDEGIQKNIEKHNSEVSKKLNDQLKNLKKGDDQTAAMIKAELQRITSPDELACKSAIQLFMNNESRNKMQTALDKHVKELESSPHNKRLTKRIGLLQAALSWVDNNDLPFDGESMLTKLGGKALAKIQKNQKQRICDYLVDTMSDNPVSESSLREGGEDIPDISTKSPECPGDGYFCKLFAGQNKKLLDEKESKFGKLKAGHCVSYAEFKTFKSIPGENLISELAKSDDPLSLLNAPAGVSTPLENDQVKFLRSNPLISRIAMDDKLKTRLGEKLKALATSLNSSKKTKGEKLSEYLNFMKRDIGSMVHSDSMKSTNEYICKNLTDSFSAIQVARDIPGLGEGPKEHCLDEIIKCSQWEHNQLLTYTNIDATLKASPVFSLAEDGEVAETEDTKEYDDFNKEICGGYEKECKGDKSEACRQKYLGQTSLKDEAKALEVAGAKKFLSKSDINRIGQKNSTQYQNNDFKKWWQKKVGSSLGGGFIAEKGKEEEFTYNKSQEQRAVAQTEIPPQFSSSSAPAVASAPASTPSSSAIAPQTKPVNKGQEIPPFVDPVPAAVKPSELAFDNKQIQKATEISQVIPGYDEMDEDDKKESLRNLKKFVEQGPNKEKTLDKLNLDEEIAELKETKKENNKILSPATAATPSAAKAFSTGRVVGLYPPLKAPSSGTPSQARLSAARRGLGPVNEVLAEINKDREEASKGSRAPASVKAKAPEMSILVKASTADASGMADPYLVPENQSIVVEDAKTYNDIRDPIKLAEYLSKTKKIDMKSLKPEDVISLHSPVNGSDAHIMLKVTKGKNNVLVFESWPVTRVAQLKHLRLNIENGTVR